MNYSATHDKIFPTIFALLPFCMFMPNFSDTVQKRIPFIKPTQHSLIVLFYTNDNTLTTPTLRRRVNKPIRLLPATERPVFDELCR